LPLQFRADRAAISTAHSWLTLSSTWAVYIVIAWAMIAAFLLGRVMLGLLQLRGLRRDCIAVDGEVSSGVREALARSGRKEVRLCTSNRIQVPTAIGFCKPTIVIPAWLMREFSPAELEHVVLHESSHLRRRDDWTNLAQKLLKAVLFFQPMVWWIDAQLSLEREMACDDLVLRHTGNPHAYAECLTSIAEKSYLRRTLLLAQAAVSRMRQTTARVARILSAQTAQPRAAVPHDSRKRWQPAACGLALLAAVAALSTVHPPQLINFSDAGSQQLAASSRPNFKMNNLSAVGSARVLPASLKLNGATLPRAVSLSAPAATPSVSTVRRARSHVRGTKELRLLAINAAARTPLQPEVSYQTVLFVMESTSFDGSGQVSSTWTMCVWRIAAPEPAPAAANSRKVT